MTCINLPARTGQQFSISHGDYEAVITELGATMRKLTYKGEDLTVALGPDDLVTCCHGQILIPFPNRIEGGEYTFEGKTYSLPIDEHDRNTAIPFKILAFRKWGSAVLATLSHIPYCTRS